MGCPLSTVQRPELSVSTSKPGESLCGVIFFHPVGAAFCWVSTSKPGESLCGNPTGAVLHGGARPSSQPPSLENPFVGLKRLWNCMREKIACLNLQAWRIPLWANSGRIAGKGNTLRVSTSKPGESLCGVRSLITLWMVLISVSTSKPGESLCGKLISPRRRETSLLSQPPSLENPFVGFQRDSLESSGSTSSQPPSLENPFVGEGGSSPVYLSCHCVSTSKPGESLCGNDHEHVTISVSAPGLNLQAWRIPLWG